MNNDIYITKKHLKFIEIMVNPVRVSVIANRFFKEIIMNIAGFPLQGLGPLASQITGNESFQNVAQVATTATQPGGLPNAALDAVADNIDLGQPGEAGLHFLRHILTGQPIDPSAVVRLIDDLGVSGDVSASQAYRGGQQLVDGNIGGGAENVLKAFGVNPSFGGFNPFDLIT